MALKQVEQPVAQLDLVNPNPTPTPNPAPTPNQVEQPVAQLDGMMSDEDFAPVREQIRD